MKHFLHYTIAGALFATILNTTAFASSTTIEKGSMGMYERQGRFVRPIMTPPTRSDASVRVSMSSSEGKVIIDKGALGKYKRFGRFVRPIIEEVSNEWPNRGRRVNPGGVVHIHGLNGKEHKNVRK